jgi:PAS domain S-box-containing protein
VLAALLAAAPAALALVDASGRVLRVNPAFAALAGVAPEGQDGRSLGDVLPGVTGEQLTALVRAVATSGRAEARAVVGETGDAPGATRRLSATVYPVRVEGKLFGLGLFLEGR